MPRNDDGRMLLLRQQFRTKYTKNQPSQVRRGVVPEPEPIIPDLNSLGMYLVDDAPTKAGWDATRRFQAAIDSAMNLANIGHKKKRGKVWIAFRIHGINLGRYGTTELISMYFAPPVRQAPILFVVDVGSAGGVTDKRFEKLLKRKEGVNKVMNFQKIRKFTHDVRITSDALSHNFRLHVQEVHDTYCYHKIKKPESDPTLEDVMRFHNLEPTIYDWESDAAILQNDPIYWARRPVTDEMMRRATVDLHQFFCLAFRQKKALNNGQRVSARKMSKYYVAALRGRKFEMLDCPNMILTEERRKTIEERTGAFLVSLHTRSNKPGSTVGVYYRKSKELYKARLELDVMD